MGPPEPGVPATLPPGPSTGPPPTTTGEPTAPPPPTTTLPPPTTTTPMPTMTKKEWWTVPPASTTPWWWPGSIWATTKAPYPWWWDKVPEYQNAYKGGYNIRGNVGIVGGPYDADMANKAPFPGSWSYPGRFAPVIEKKAGPTVDPNWDRWHQVAPTPKFIQTESSEDTDSYTGEHFVSDLQQKMLHDATQGDSHSHTRSKAHPSANSPTGQAIFLDESPGMCNCPACPKDPNIGKMPWEQEDWGNPWDRFMAPN